MMTYLIIEDEPLVAKNLEKLVSEIYPNFQKVAQISSVTKAIDWFRANPKPDLIFMDIQLSDGNSFEIIESIDIQSPVIFTTAYNEYVLKAFKVNSIDYLLKPIDTSELTRAIQKFQKWGRASQKNTTIESLREILSGLGKGTPKPKLFRHRFLVHLGHTLVPLEANQIAVFYREEIIFAKAMDNQKYITDFHTLEELESDLDPSLFFRANRQHIIHIQAVESCKSGNNGKLLVRLKNPVGMEIEISREKATDFKQWLS